MIQKEYDIFDLNKDVSVNTVNSDDVTENGTVYKQVNEKWLLVLHLVKCLEKSKYSIKVGRTIFQKICYVLTRCGTDLGLNFVKGTYGPYSSEIKNMITILSNNNLIIEKECGQMILLEVSDKFKIDSSRYSIKEKEDVNHTFQLFQRIKDTYQAELVTTILFSFDQLKLQKDIITEDCLYEYIISWKKRYNTPRTEERIRELSKGLTTMEFIDLDYSHGFKSSDLF